jgi:hypothetical protein
VCGLCANSSKLKSAQERKSTTCANSAKLEVIENTRHVGFRFQFPQGSEGSSPFVRTNNLLEILIEAKQASVDYRWTFWFGSING